jgi:uncharacterized protein (TIGR02266 family)
MDEPSSPEGNAITLRIKFKSASLADFVARYGADVSAGGIFIRTKQPLAVGSLLHFDFSLADGSPLLAGVGTVVWVREVDSSRAASIPGMGLRFDQLAPESQQIHQQILAAKAGRGERPTGTPPPSPAAMLPARPAAMPAMPPLIVPPRALPATTGAALPSGRVTPDTFDEFSSGGKTEIAERPPRFYFDTLDDARGAAAGGRQGEEAAPGTTLEDTETDSHPTMVPDLSVSEPIDISEDAGGAVLSPRAAAAQAAAPGRGRFGSVGDELAPAGLDLPLGSGAGSGRYADLPPALETGSGSDGAAPVGPAAEQGWLDRAINVRDGAGSAPVEMPAEHTEETAAPPELTEQAGVASGEAERPMLEGAEDFGQDVPDLPAQKPAGQGKRLIVVGIVAAGLAFAGVYLLQAKPWQTPAVPVSRSKPAVPAPTPVVPPALPKVGVPSQPAVQPTSAKAEPVKAAENVPAPKPTPAKAEPVKAAENAPAPKPAEAPAKTPPPAVEAAKSVEAAEASKHPGPAAGSAKKTASKPASSPPSSPAPAGQDEIVYLLKVRSVPPGAQVLIDGEPMGQTPFQRRILDADKPHTVSIRKPGYLLYERSISPSGPWVKDGNTKTTNVAARLTKSKAQPAETSAAPGAQPEPATDQPDKL